MSNKKKPQTFHGYALARQGSGDWWAFKDGKAVYEAMTLAELKQLIYTKETRARTYRVIDDRDGSNVFGADVPGDNATLVSSVGETPLHALKVGEWQVRTFTSSGRGYYRVTRIS